MKSYLIFALALMFLPTVVLSAPVIEVLSGYPKSGGQIVINGYGFGADAPNVVLFEDYNTETVGETPNATAEIGEWTEGKGEIWADNMLSGGVGNRVNYSAQQVQFGGDYTEVFMSAIAYSPVGNEFLPSNLKFFWLMDSGDGYQGITEGADFYGPSWTGADWNVLTSNDACGLSTWDRTGTTSWQNDVTLRFVDGSPTRWSIWLKSNGLSTAGTDGMFQSVNASGQTTKDYFEYKPMFCVDHPKQSWDRLNVIGYVANASYPPEALVTDDIYVAVGANAAARVEIGNNAVYSACTKLAIATPDSWSDTSITVTIREGGFNDGDQVYIFVVDAENTSSNGFGLILGRPLPPTNISVE